MRIRFPWFTLYGNPGARPRWRCAAAMVAHELLFEPWGLLIGRGEHARPNRWTTRYAIGVPYTFPLHAMRGSHIVIGSDTLLSSVPVVDGGFLFVMDGATTSSGARGAAGRLIGLYRGNAANNQWEPVAVAGAMIDLAGVENVLSQGSGDVVIGDSSFVNVLALQSIDSYAAMLNARMFIDTGTAGEAGEPIVIDLLAMLAQLDFLSAGFDPGWAVKAHFDAVIAGVQAYGMLVHPGAPFSTSVHLFGLGGQPITDPLQVNDEIVFSASWLLVVD